MLEDKFELITKSLDLSEDEQKTLKSAMKKDSDELNGEEAALLIKAAGVIRREDRREEYKNKSHSERELDHQRAQKLFGAYTAFIAAACLTVISSSNESSYYAWAISFWIISLPFLTGGILLDYRIRVVQKRENSRVYGLFFGVGGISSHIGTSIMTAYFSWLAALIFALSPLLVAFLFHEVAALGGKESFEDF